MTLGGNKTPFSFVVTDRSTQAGLTTYVQALQSKLEAGNMGTAFCICGGFSSGQDVNKSKQDLDLDEDDSFLKSTLPEYRVQISADKGDKLQTSSTTPADTPDRIVFCMTNSHEPDQRQASGIWCCEMPRPICVCSWSRKQALCCLRKIHIGLCKMGRQQSN